MYAKAPPFRTCRPKPEPRILPFSVTPIETVVYGNDKPVLVNGEVFCPAKSQWKNREKKEINHDENHKHGNEIVTTSAAADISSIGEHYVPPLSYHDTAIVNGPHLDLPEPTNSRQLLLFHCTCHVENHHLQRSAFQ